MRYRPPWTSAKTHRQVARSGPRPGGIRQGLRTHRDSCSTSWLRRAGATGDARVSDHRSVGSGAGGPGYADRARSRWIGLPEIAHASFTFSIVYECGGKRYESWRPSAVAFFGTLFTFMTP